MKKQQIIFISLVVFGLLIRALFAILPGFKIDVDAWFAWAIRLNDLGLNNFYSKDLWTNYTPGYLYILYLLGAVKHLFSLDDTSFYYLLKLPAILADIVLAIVVYYDLQKTNFKKYAIYLAAFILFNPVLIFNGSVWGQIDSILALLMVLSIRYLSLKSLVAASITYGLALLIKPQAIALLPIYGLYLLRDFSWRSILKLSLPGIVTIFLLSWPFFLASPISGFTTLVQSMTNDYKYNSLFAYNLWGIAGFWIDDSQLLAGISFQIWGLLLLSSYWLMLIYFFFKKRLSVVLVASLACLAFYFLPTRVHDRYLYPALIFLILTIIEQRSKILVGLISVLSLLHLFNLYYVYTYYNQFYLHLSPVLYNSNLYHFLDTFGPQLSLFSTIIFGVISYILIFKKKSDTV